MGEKGREAEEVEVVTLEKLNQINTLWIIGTWFLVVQCGMEEN